MSDVLALAGVSVVRGDTVILDDVSWEVEEGQRWVVLGPNGAGKTTLLQLAAARIHPTTGVAGILGEVLGTVDVFELRPRIGLASAALADRIPAARAGARRRRHRLLRRRRSLARGLRPARRGPGRRAARGARGAATSPTAASARSPRASASGCRSPGR